MLKVEPIFVHVVQLASRNTAKVRRNIDRLERETKVTTDQRRMREDSISKERIYTYDIYLVSN